MKDRDVLFHEKWLGLAQPIEGLVFSVPVLADAQIAPELSPSLSTAFAEHLIRDESGPRIRHLPPFLRGFLGYSREGMLVPRGELPEDLSFYAPEGGQEIRPSFALGRGPFAEEDPFALFDGKASAPAPQSKTPPERFFALVWDLTEHEGDLDLDAPETSTGPWRYAPTAKFERLLRHTGIPVGLLFNGRELRLLYAPAGETTGHLTFRVAHMDGPEGRPLLAAMELLLHARRAYSASPEHTLGGLLGESRRRQADVTEKLAKQVFEAVEILIAGFEAAAAREGTGARHDWLRPALEAEGDHFYQGILSVVLRLVFLLYSEDQSLLPVEHPLFAEHLSLAGLYQRLSHDAGAHPESMHHRFGAYGQLLALFRAVFFGVKHGDLSLPPRRGRLFDPNTYPFLEGGLPNWTAAVANPEARAAVRPPNIDDGTIHRVLHRLVVFEGQRLSYRTLDVEQIGSIYESLMGYHVVRLVSPAVRMGKFGVWVEVDALRSMSPSDRARFLKETCGLNPGPVQAIEKLFREASAPDALLEGLASHAIGKKAEQPQHRAPAGRLVLQPGEERRRTGSHYTPRSLTEKVVKRTLEPLLACLGPDRTVEQILELKICDPAMGSGAFLVATCRELASEIVAAWAREKKLAAVVEIHGNAHLHACRLVAQRCLYGVDKNPAAVELAKLSLWLVTLSRTLPFTFVDHALRHGDSLVGLDFKQIQAFHWAPSKQLEIFKDMLEEALEQAVSQRQQIAALAFHDDPDSQAEKRRLFDFSQQAIERIRTIADACVGAFFSEQKDTAREKERNRRLDLIETWLTKPPPASDAAGAEIARLASDARTRLSPFHWWIEFPEVFFEQRPDPLLGGRVDSFAQMDAIVGNPPFAGGTKVSAEQGQNYLKWLVAQTTKSTGNVDLAAFFVRRAITLLGRTGAIGVVTTNSILAGDSRGASVDAIAELGYSKISDDEPKQWPGSSANVAYVEYVSFRNTGINVAQERDAQVRKKPARLAENEPYCRRGADVFGTNGFVLNNRQEVDDLVQNDPKSEEVIHPYLGGSEFNNSPTLSPSRFCIDFQDMSEEEAKKYSAAFKRVEELVKPARAGVKQKDRRELWWIYATRAPEIRSYLSIHHKCLCIPQLPKHIAWGFLENQSTRDVVLANTVNAALLSSMTSFASLQSRLHGCWAKRWGGSMRTDVRYTSTDCFETFPFPQPDPRAVIPSLEGIGERLYEARARYMVDTDQGLTKTYNALKDPGCEDERILELRRLHEEMDRAVLDAYGWKDIAVPPYCPKSDEDRAALQAFEDEVIDRLYVLNAERAAEEQREAAKAPTASKARGKKSGEAAPAKRKGKKGEGQGDLF